MISDQTRFSDVKPEASVDVPKGYRQLKWNEVVIQGDFLVDENRGFEPWQGPGGFRADTFVKPIYRRGKVRPSRRAAGKSS
jgi:hypothetical protein